MTGEKSPSSHCVCSPFVAKRLECVRFSAAFCPSRTSENSQQHARVIYGWVHGPQQIQSLAGTTEIFLDLFGQQKSVFISVHPWLETRFCETNPICGSWCITGLIFRRLWHSFGELGVYE
jgi:hypothetical protein